MHQRFSWLLATQAILFASYGVLLRATAEAPASAKDQLELVTILVVFVGF